MKILLGVIDQPYSVFTEPVQRRASVKRAKGGKIISKTTKPANGAQTTSDVAKILEDKYHIMGLFVEERYDYIADQLAESVSDKIQDILNGAPIDGSPIDAGALKIEDRFKQFLSLQEVERLGIPGVPTQAALDGVNHGLKIRKGKRRPSFIDTGLYRASFKVWTE